MKYHYPIILRNKKLGPFKFSQEVGILRLQSKEREEFFGLKKIDFVFQIPPVFGHVAFNQAYPSKTKAGILPYSSRFQGAGPFAEIDDIFASNYIVVIDCDGIESRNSLIDKINLTFKLLQPTSTGAYIGFRKNIPGFTVFPDKPIGGPFGYLYLKKQDIHRLKKIFILVNNNKDDSKFKLVSELYSRSISGTKNDFDIRFLMLTTALECLYLPEEPNQELTFRLCLRVANLFGLLGNGKPQAIYEMVKEFYDIRSQIVHHGKSKNLNMKRFVKLVEIIRLSIIHYLNNKSLFNKETLKNICLRPYVVSK
jgi:hypothetical protein